LLVGQVAQSPDRRLRARLAADYERLKFLRVLRSHDGELIEDQGTLLAGPKMQQSDEKADAQTEATDG
jgi:rod shape-determining protein MreC